MAAPQAPPHWGGVCIAGDALSGVSSSGGNRVPRAPLLPGGPAVSRRAQRAGRPHWGATLTLWRDASPPVSRGAGLGSPPTTRKETLVAIGWLSGGTMPQGGSGKLQVSVRRGQRSLLTRSHPQEQRLCAARPGGWGAPEEASGSGAQCPAIPVLCAWPPSLPPRPPVCGGPGGWAIPTWGWC